jgi:hypothetical protein
MIIRAVRREAAREEPHRNCGLGGVPPAPALGLAALRPILFLHADEAQTTAVFPDDPGPLDPLGEPLQQLLKRLGFFQFDTHARQ